MALLMRNRIIAAVVAVAIAALGYYVVRRPAPAPHVRFATLSGQELTTRDLHGKVLLVNFWATWCASCIKETPKLIDTHRKYAPRGYETIAVAVRDQPAAVAAFASARALPFTVALDTSGEVARRFGNVHVTPQSVLIDRQGRIVARYVGEPDWAELHATIDKLL
jgi:peroxiredoxin